MVEIGHEAQIVMPFISILIMKSRKSWVKDCKVNYLIRLWQSQNSEVKPPYMDTDLELLIFHECSIIQFFLKQAVSHLIGDNSSRKPSFIFWMVSGGTCNDNQL